MPLSYTFDFTVVSEFGHPLESPEENQVLLLPLLLLIIIITIIVIKRWRREKRRGGEGREKRRDSYLGFTPNQLSQNPPGMGPRISTVLNLTR